MPERSAASKRETGGFESRPSCPLCRMIDERSPPLLFPHFFLFSLSAAAPLVSLFFAPRLSSRIPSSCHPRREEKTRALFDCVVGSCREHQEPRNGNGSCPSLHRDKDAISLLVEPACLYFVFLYNRGSVVPRLIEIPDREECYGARVQRKSIEGGTA